MWQPSVFPHVATNHKIWLASLLLLRAHSDLPRRSPRLLHSRCRLRLRPALVNKMHPGIRLKAKVAPTFAPSLIGTTISLRLSPSQAICPGNASTSLTSTVLPPPSAAAPHTPFPIRMVWHATFPMKGPRINWPSGSEGSRT